MSKYSLTLEEIEEYREYGNKKHKVLVVKDRLEIVPKRESERLIDYYRKDNLPPPFRTYGRTFIQPDLVEVRNGTTFITKHFDLRKKSGKFSVQAMTVSNNDATPGALSFTNKVTFSIPLPQLYLHMEAPESAKFGDEITVRAGVKNYRENFYSGRVIFKHFLEENNTNKTQIENPITLEKNGFVNFYFTLVPSSAGKLVVEFQSEEFQKLKVQREIQILVKI